MLEKAYGKINVSINVLRRRLDGYHDLDMIMVPIKLHDDLEIEIADQMSYECNIPMEFNDSNTVVKAVSILRREFEFKENFKIRLTKRIPMQAGLAGGSADGAAVLRAVNQLLGLGLSYSQLALFGREIGADVSFCIYQQCARVQGTGEIILPFYLEKGYDVILVKPQQGISTKLAYTTLNLDKCDHPDIDKVKDALISHKPLCEVMGNSLEESATRLLGEIERIKNKARSLGFKDVLMSGSGSTVFVITEKGTDTAKLIEEMKKEWDFVIKTEILTA
ncbi:MAG: 4-(cytidine 5'-diphospho)-2-C-methyl-D-erythritol kinase [Erysipelotrichaceae bacterium]|nr:4-(cytidine 5'-diphospho)-2-C-methyl-D-erythritol kinase [Erysipelotrichaceae bacterium]